PRQSIRHGTRSRGPPPPCPRRRPGGPMTSGAEMNRNTDEMFRALKPTNLENMVAEAYVRRREHDLANAVDESKRGRAARRRMPHVLVAGLAVGAVAAAAPGVIVATG